MSKEKQERVIEMFTETITATSPILKITEPPVPYYTQDESEEIYHAYVTKKGSSYDNSCNVNYGVNKNTREIQNFTAEVGKEYCVSYYIDMGTIQTLDEFAERFSMFGDLKALLGVK